MASVPNDTHDVDLVLSEGTFSQSFDLWTLRRVPPSPAVLYRDPTQTSLTGTAAGPTTLSLSNPADGFTSSANVTLQSATLGFFAPSGTTLVAEPRPGRALGRARRASSPTTPTTRRARATTSGSTAPLPASMLTFTPSGGTRGRRPRSATPATRPARATPTTASSTPPTRSSSRPR